MMSTGDAPVSDMNVFHQIVNLWKQTLCTNIPIQINLCGYGIFSEYDCHAIAGMAAHAMI